MAEPLKPRKLDLPTVRGERTEVRCPICGNDEFLSFAPDVEKAKREGFRHVIMGMYGEDQLNALPVRFWYCANCGYTLNFIIGRFD
jgi:rubrerythrin